ncbi:nuclear transport factor 2 family protein [Actinomadura sp. SCN-SB]|uniref:nuclear transport factor 2 family protein n=1 Tax=Actinomadura sp. SCN-SB TaxID=3373092 RepID=UPI003750F72E
MSTNEDRTSIVEICTRMAWHADQREWDQLATIFADEVTLDYTSLNGGEPVTLTPADIVAGWRDALGAYAATQHLITNHLVTVDGGTAVCTASFQATHRHPGPLGDAPLWTLGGDYRFDLVRAGGEWRIAGVVMTAKWSQGDRETTTMEEARS